MQTMINLPYRFNLHSLQVRWGNPKPQTPRAKAKACYSNHDLAKSKI
jgi:hypothetical protein